MPLEDSHFRRQAPVGPYFADFACHTKRLVIELDGGQHHSDDQERAEVDQHVAADDEVQLGERRVARQILARKDAGVAHMLADAIAPVHF